MHDTQKRYAAAKAIVETLAEEMVDQPTDAICAQYMDAMKARMELGTQMIRWALGVMRSTIPAAQFSQIEHLEELTRKNALRRAKLEELCFKFNGA